MHEKSITCMHKKLKPDNYIYIYILYIVFVFENDIHSNIKVKDLLQRTKNVFQMNSSHKLKQKVKKHQEDFINDRG